MKRTIPFLLGAVMAFFGCGGEPKNFPNGYTQILCLGDSITAGYGIGEENAYPAFLAKQTGRSVVNFGVSGNTTQQALERFKEYGDKSYMVIVLLNGNDFFQQVSLDETMKYMREIVDLAQSRGAMVVIVETGGAFLMNKYHKPLKQMAKDTGSLFVPKVMDKVLSDNSMKFDNIHPNAKGSEKIAQTIYKVIKPYL